MAKKPKKNPACFRYVNHPYGYQNSNLHKDFRVTGVSEESIEAHKFLKAAAALEGVPMVRLHRVSPSVRRKLCTAVGDNKTLEKGWCTTIRDSMLQELLLSRADT